MLNKPLYPELFYDKALKLIQVNYKLARKIYKTLLTQNQYQILFELTSNYTCVNPIYLSDIQFSTELITCYSKYNQCEIQLFDNMQSLFDTDIYISDNVSLYDISNELNRSKSLISNSRILSKYDFPINTPTFFTHKFTYGHQYLMDQCGFNIVEIPTCMNVNEYFYSKIFFRGDVYLTAASYDFNINNFDVRLSTRQLSIYERYNATANLTSLEFININPSKKINISDATILDSYVSNASYLSDNLIVRYYQLQHIKRHLNSIRVINTSHTNISKFAHTRNNFKVSCNVLEIYEDDLRSGLLDYYNINYKQLKVLDMW